MEEKNKLTSKGSKKVILIATLALLVVILIVWFASSKNQAQNNVPIQEQTNQENSLMPGDESSIPSEVSPVSITPTGTDTPATSEPVTDAPIEKTSPITVQVAVNETGFSPSVINVKAGQEVTLSITASNGTSIIVFNNGIAAATGISSGQTKDIKFTAPTARGEYSFRNDVPTKGFIGTIIVK